MRVFHNGQRALTGATAAEAVDEVSQTILVQGAGEEQTCGQGADEAEDEGQVGGGDQPKDASHHAARDPSGKGPVGDEPLETVGGHAMYPPPRQPREERQRRKHVIYHNLRS